MSAGAAMSALSEMTTAGEFWSRTAALTESGQVVLAGQRDRVSLNGLDRWLGGVHLQGNEARWRWNQAAQRLQHA